MPDPFGFLNIHKPAGMTSHDVVGKLRRGLRIKKVGHAGTLDPMATGVLVICLGRATRLSEYVMASTKQYQAQVTLGAVTDTYDAEGEILQSADCSHITVDDVTALLPEFTGDIDQLPPVYSAIKRDGKKLYELARAGEEVELEPRLVTIHSLSLGDWSPPTFALNVRCGSGTYIRSLAHDIGQRLDVGAHLSALERTASGQFFVGEAASPDDVLRDGWEAYLISPGDALVNLPAVHLNDEDADHIRHGRNPRHVLPAGGDTARAFDPHGNLIAILRAENGIWSPHKVFLD